MEAQVTGKYSIARVSGAWRRKGPSGRLALAVLVAAAGCRGTSDSRSVPAESSQLLYAQHCLGCHGATGEGLYGPNIQGLNRSTDQIVAVINGGRGKMPGFSGDLSKEQMRQVAGYVKRFRYKP